MGITGLLQFIKDASEPISIKQYKGQTVAVDTYCWLHKGAFSCAEKLAKGEPTDQYVIYCMKFVDMLLSFGVKPILVFDGCNLPSKRDVDKSRRERRQANLQKGKQLLREGKITEARECFTRSITVTPTMAHNVIKAARTRGVDCVVAPYEADAQLAFLNKAGIAQAVITEDSDLLAFGCKKVVLKMDMHGNGLEIDQNHLGRCRSLGDVFTEEKFRHMCILSGCDYLASLYGIGLGKACKLLRMANNPDILKVIRKMAQYLKMNVVVPEEYVDGFVQANNTFLYQLVFDPIQRKVVPLNPYPEHLDPATLCYAGRNVGDAKGFQMALGNLDIHTMEQIDDFNPDTNNVQPTKPRSRSWNDPKASQPSGQSSIWRRGYTPGSLSPVTRPPLASSPERPLTTRGKERVISLQGLRLPCRESQAKRPRHDSSISDQDVLHQYSPFSNQKRARTSETPTTPDPTGPAGNPSRASCPKPRNCFATLLQRRNQDVEGEDQGTRSRFFSSSSEVAGKEEFVVEAQRSHLDQTSPSPPIEDKPETDESEGPSVHSVDTPSPPSSPSPSPRAAGQGLGVFHWSGSASSAAERPGSPAASGLVSLQQFQRRKESSPWSRPPVRRTETSGSPLTPETPSNTSPPDQKEEETEEEEKEEGTPPCSPPSQDSAYFSQGQRQEVSSCVPSPLPARLDDAAGLSRLKPGDRGNGRKIQPSAPARASGLRKRARANDENSPGFQATISGLWKNYAFQK
ncbi:exonuclease 1 [Aplochiton taeniatus]